MSGALTAAFHLGLVGYVAALLALAGYVRRGEAAMRVAWGWLAGIGFAAHTVSLILESVVTGRSPSLNAATFPSFLAWVIVGGSLVMSAWLRLSVVGLVSLPIAAGLMLFSGTSLETLAQGNLTPVGPAGPGLAAHASFSFLGYAGFTISFAAALLYLAQDRSLKSHRPGAAVFRLPSLEVLDRVAHEGVASGLVFLAVGIVAGILWLHRARGVFLSGDIKEGASLVVWVTYLVIWVMHRRSIWRGRRHAVVCLGAFVLLALMFLGINALFPSGWHRLVA